MTRIVASLMSDLLEMVPVRLAEARTNDSIPREHGVYLFSDRGAHLFVGSAEGTRGIRSRVGEHAAVREETKEKVRKGLRSGAACTLATNLALEELGMSRPDWKSPTFGEAVVRHMARVEGMELRWVTVEDAELRRTVTAWARLHLAPRYNRR